MWFAIITCACVCIASFLAGRCTARSNGVTLKWMPSHQTVEVWRGTDLVYEIQPDDGKLFTELMGVMDESTDGIPTIEEEQSTTQPARDSRVWRIDYL